MINHPWLKEINYDDLMAKKIKPMFIPQLSKKNPADISNFDEDFTQQEARVSVVPEAGQRKIERGKNLFDDFDR